MYVQLARAYSRPCARHTPARQTLTTELCLFVFPRAQAHKNVSVEMHALTDRQYTLQYTSDNASHFYVTRFCPTK